ncbi:MAG: hypothetical protein NC112_03910 [Oxalobacter formigenes]|nr:hypothetical protein [Oxalobacter formigenes]
MLVLKKSEISVMRIQSPGFEEIFIKKEDLADDMYMSCNHIDHLHLFCMHTVYIERGLTLKEASKALKLPPKFHFWRTCCFCAIRTFFKEIGNHIKKEEAKTRK